VFSMCIFDDDDCLQFLVLEKSCCRCAYLMMMIAFIITLGRKNVVIVFGTLSSHETISGDMRHVLQCVATCCNVLQCVAICCSVLSLVS